MIEQTWTHLCTQSNFGLQIINVDETPLTPHLPHLLSADLIVVTCFNTKIAKAIKVVREKLQIDTRIFFYLHGLATIALWPLQRFEILNLMTSNDVFIGTCEGDIKSMKLSLTNAHTVKVPFTILELPTVSPATHSTRPFVFIGRISPQKNLNQLISAYSQLNLDLRQKHPLIFFGTEDNLGFPNLGIKEKSYLNKLQTLVKELGLEKFVNFRGFVDRIKIQEELGNNYIFVGPSTHSDENFGMAAFRALLSGAPCILSAWGGHNEFARYYSKQIQYIRPHTNENGPYIAINELTNAMEQALGMPATESHNYPADLTLDSICSSLKALINTSSERKQVIPTPMALTIFDQQKDFEKNNEIQQCFKSFTDPAFVVFFEAYSVICRK